MSGTGIEGVLHPVIITGDFERSVAFYRDIIGLVPGAVRHHDPRQLASLGAPRDAIARAIVLKAPDGTEIEIATFDRPRGRPVTESQWPDAGIRSFTFVVADIKAMSARAAAAGYPLMGRITPFIEEGHPVLVCYIKGPDGVIVTLLQTRNVAEV